LPHKCGEARNVSRQNSCKAPLHLLTAWNGHLIPRDIGVERLWCFAQLASSRGINVAAARCRRPSPRRSGANPKYKLFFSVISGPGIGTKSLILRHPVSALSPIRASRTEFAKGHTGDLQHPGAEIQSGACGVVASAGSQGGTSAPMLRTTNSSPGAPRRCFGAPEHGPAAIGAHIPQVLDDHVYFRRSGDGNRSGDELP
jgi:hypothetical protein